MRRKKFIRMTLSDEDMKQALLVNGISEMPACRREAEDKLLAIGTVESELLNSRGDRITMWPRRYY